jgi:IS30 family transposase
VGGSKAPLGHHSSLAKILLAEHCVPLQKVTVDNGKQFDCASFRSFYDQLGMKLCFASVYHPQSNGAVKRANGIIFTSIKKNITKSEGQMGG